MWQKERGLCCKNVRAEGRGERQQNYFAAETELCCHAGNREGDQKLRNAG